MSDVEINLPLPLSSSQMTYIAAVLAAPVSLTSSKTADCSVSRTFNCAFTSSGDVAITNLPDGQMAVFYITNNAYTFTNIIGMSGKTNKWFGTGGATTKPIMSASGQIDLITAQVVGSFLHLTFCPGQ